MKAISHTPFSYKKILLIMLFPAMLGVGYLAAQGMDKPFLFLFILLGYMVLALVNYQVALILAIPLQLSASLGFLEFSDIEFYGFNLQSVTLLVLVLASANRFFTKKIKWKTTELDKPLLIFFLLVYFLWSFWDRGNIVIPNYAHLSSVKQISFYVLNYFIALNSGMDERWLKRLTMAMMFVILFVGGRDLWLFYQAGGLTQIDWRYSRLVETMGFEIVGGNTLLQGVFLAVAFSQAFTRRGVGAVIWGGVGVLALVDILFSFYRSAFLMAAVIVVIVIFLLKTRRSIPILLLLILVFLLLIPASISERITYTFTTGDEQIGQMALNTTGRISYHWPRSWEVAMAYFPLGTGYLQLPIARGDGYTAFNQFLNWFAEFGIVGIAIAFWMIVSISWYLWRAISQNQSPFLKAYFVGLLSAWCGILVRNLTGDAFSYVWLAVFMLLLGAGASCLQQPKDMTA